MKKTYKKPIVKLIDIEGESCIMTGSNTKARLGSYGGTNNSTAVADDDANGFVGSYRTTLWGED